MMAFFHADGTRSERQMILDAGHRLHPDELVQRLAQHRKEKPLAR